MLEPWGEKIIKEFVREAMDEALQLEMAMARLRVERKVVVLHYAPISATVVNEPEQIFPFMGSSRLMETICRFGAEVVFHGHAHNGTPQGTGPQDIPVYNVSLPLMQRVSPDRPYVICEL
jgi:Icc-related predicted phosphoesterase